MSSKASSGGSRRGTPPPSSSLSLSDADVDPTCPLCLEEMDASDCRFKPCPCGYQICRFCWHRIREEENERCPACRRIYTDEDIEFLETPIRSVKKPPTVTAVTTAKLPPSQPSTPTPTSSGIISGRKHLAELRVIQKNLVYVIGISARIAHEHILKEPEYFGQFGKILKIVVNRRSGPQLEKISTDTTTTSGSAYVTFARPEDAARAISYVDESVFDGRILRATYGTTKYCSFFLRATPCPNPGCMYLHEEGDVVDSYTKEELTGKMHLHSNLVSSTEESQYRQFGTVMYRPSPPPSRVTSPSPVIVESRVAASSSTPQPPKDPIVTSPINLAQCEDEALSFLNRLSRWNQPMDLDLDPPRSPRPPTELTDDSTSFDPFSATTAPLRKRMLPWHSGSKDELSQQQQSVGRFDSVPMIAKGSLPGFDWSPIMRDVSTPEVVTFKRSGGSIGIRPAPVGSPVSSSSGWGSSSNLNASAPGFDDTHVASPSPISPANLEHLFGVYSQRTSHPPVTTGGGRKVVDATMLERQFFQEPQPVTTTIPLAANEPSIVEPSLTPGIVKFNMVAAAAVPSAGEKAPEKNSDRIPDKVIEKRSKATSVTGSNSTTSNTPLATPTPTPTQQIISGKKKVAPAPQLPPVKPIIPVTRKLSSSSSSTVATPKSPIMNKATSSISQQNLFSVLDDGDANSDDEESSSANPSGSKKGTKPIKVTEQAIESMELKESTGTPLTNTAASKKKKQKKVLEEAVFIHKPPPTLSSQPAYTIEWPTSQNNYHPIVAPRLSLMNDTERLAYRKWLEEEAKVCKQEEAALRAKAMKMHNDMLLWINTVISQ